MEDGTKREQSVNALVTVLMTQDLVISRLQRQTPAKTLQMRDTYKCKVRI